MHITFRQCELADAKLMREWCKQNEYTRHWYYFDKVPRLSTFERKIREKKQLKDWRFYIVQIDGKDIGYIQSYPVDGNGNWTKQVKVKECCASIDYFIGDINYIHKGLGKLILLEYIKKQVKPLGFEYALISPDPENTANRNLVEKCGFTYIKTVGVPFDTSKEKEGVYIKKIWI